ncbi:MAG: RIP metalloprotease [Alphaproteobacteria bacterium GM202ARS2]|nr:RIP metalloprotease [Alphaproteobacteria bacterium GM202ARS2]
MDILATLSSGIGGIVPVILVISVLVFVHEWGHYAVARWYGVHVDVFSIGFGPELGHVMDKAGTRWRFALIPLGGYVKFRGDEDATSMKAAQPTEAGDIQSGHFHAQPLLPKIWILLAGPAANIVFALLVLWAFYFSHGIAVIEPIVGKVVPDSLAERYGIQENDHILAIDEQDVDDFLAMRALIQSHEAGTDMTIVLLREGQQLRLVIPEMASSTLGFYATGSVREKDGQTQLQETGLGDSLVLAWNETWFISGAIIRFIGKIVRGDGSMDDVGGPVRIAEGTSMAWEQGWASLVRLVALISINLGIFNLLPIPPLDGGQIFLYVAEKVGKRNSEALRIWGYQLGFFFLITVLVFVTWHDIVRLIGNG